MTVNTIKKKKGENFHNKFCAEWQRENEKLNKFITEIRNMNFMLKVTFNERNINYTHRNGVSDRNYFSLFLSASSSSIFEKQY